MKNDHRADWSFRYRQEHHPHQLEGGEVLSRVITRGCPCACMLTSDAGQLYITTSETEYPQEEKTRRSGRIEVTRV